MENPTTVDQPLMFTEHKEDRVHRGSNLSDSEKYYDLEKVIKESETSGKKVVLRLISVSAVCILFMSAEIVGGILANSLAIMTDAGHLFSDFFGFLVSIISLWIGRRPATRSLSYGYARAEVIGALCSVVIIWGLAALFIYEGVEKILNPRPVDGKIMFITACFGLGCNLVMMKILHSHGHDHGHDHGNGHNHEHEHAHKAEHKHDHQHEHESHSHSHPHKHDHQRGKYPGSARSGCSNCELDNEIIMPKTKETLPSLGDLENKQEEVIMVSKEDQQVVESLQEIQNLPKNGTVDKKSKKKVKAEAADSKQRTRSLSQADVHENVNLRAAFIHILGDIVQSIGVIIASVIIWVKPDWHLADPICTFIFSIISLFTTFRVLGFCIKILMEGSPHELDHEAFEAGLYTVVGVVDVHDLHVWLLSAGKPAMSAHLVSTDPDETLKHATRYVRKFGIFHSTLQVERVNTHGRDIKIACAHNVHQ